MSHRNKQAAPAPAGAQSGDQDDPYAHIPPPVHSGHAGIEWQWHSSNKGHLSGSSSFLVQRLCMIIRGCFFGYHNDTMNVYTHFGGSLYFVYYGFATFMRLGTLDAGLTDRFVFLIYALLVLPISTPISLTAQVALCFFMSAYYHLLRSHSHAVFRKLLTLDIAGIGLCIAAADLLVSHFEMRCHLALRPVYATVVFILLGASLFYVPILVKFRRTNQRTIIMATFSCIAIGSLFHRLLLSGGFIAVDQGTTVRCLVALLFTYGWIFIGLVIRRLKLPERMLPRIFDGASHQLFHMCTIIGTARLFWAYVTFYEEGIIRYCHHAIAQQA